MTRTSRLVLAAAALAALVLLGGYASLVVGGYGVMYSDTCGGSDGHGLICSRRGQAIVFFVPLVGWAVAAVLGTVSVVRWVRRGEDGWWPMAVGVGVMVIAMAIAVWIAESTSP